MNNFSKTANLIIKEKLEKLSQKESLLEERKREIYASFPEIFEIDKRLKTSVIKVSRLAFESGTDASSAMHAIKEENLALSARKREILMKNGYSSNYLTLNLDCQNCLDTGYIGTVLCDCIKDEIAKKQTERLLSFKGTQNQSFENFDLSFYSEVPDKRLGISPKQNARYNYDLCREFAHKFGDHNQNLFLFGSAGLGKTFLSSAIAREVSSKGFSVIYETISSIIDCYERDKFSNDEDARDKISEYYKADLLIIDDLGTEMSTTFTLSATYTLINRRLMDEKPLILNTNLNILDISRRYNEAIASRIDGQFAHLRFFGEDIRRLKKMRGN